VNKIKPSGGIALPISVAAGKRTDIFRSSAPITDILGDRWALCGGKCSFQIQYGEAPARARAGDQGLSNLPAGWKLVVFHYERPVCAKTCRCSKLELWTPHPSARLTALQYSISEPRWITDLDQGKQTHYLGQHLNARGARKIPPDSAEMRDRSRPHYSNSIIYDAVSALI
jgi:hypothetical protein